MQLFRTRRIVVIIGTIWLLTGCIHQPVGRTQQTHPAKAHAAVPYGITCSAKQWQKQVNKVQGHGVHLSLLGDYIFLIVPSHKIFSYGTSSHIKNRQTLDAVISFLNCYQKIAITVKAYTNLRGTQTENKALSVQQAHAVTNYFWHHGIDSRLMTAIGEGHKLNMRGKCLQQIEIAFRKLP